MAREVGRRPRLAGVLVGLLAASLVLSLFLCVPPGRAQGMGSPNLPLVNWVNISATGSFAFQPSIFSVTPGATVHLAVTQLANVNHTFTLSPVANQTIPSSDTATQMFAYFQAHTPIVNLSLGMTPGSVTTRTFVAPTVGTYEFVCEFHFVNGMIGTMDSGISSSSGSSSPTTLVIIVVVVVLVVAVVVAVIAMRGRRTPPPSPPLPPTPPTPPSA